MICMFWAQIYFCLAFIHLFVTAYLSKSLNLSEKSSKMIKIQYTDPKLVSPQPGHVRPAVGALGGRHEVQGGRQGAQGAAPSPGSLGGSLALRTQREGRDVRAVFIGQLHNYCLPMRRGHSWWWVVGDGGVGGGGGWGRPNYMLCGGMLCDAE